MSGAHSHKRQSRPKTPSTGRRGWVIAITLVSVAVVAVGLAAVTIRGNSGRAAASPTSSPTAEIGVTTHRGPFRVISEAPASGTTQVPSDATVSVQFSEAIGAHSPTPSLA